LHEIAPREGALGVAVVGVQVHHQGGVGGPQRQGEVLWCPMRVGRVDHAVAEGHARDGHGDKHIDHLRHGVVVACDEAHASYRRGHGRPALVGHQRRK